MSSIAPVSYLIAAAALAFSSPSLTPKAQESLSIAREYHQNWGKEGYTDNKAFADNLETVFAELKKSNFSDKELLAEVSYLKGRLLYASDYVSSFHIQAFSVEQLTTGVSPVLSAVNTLDDLSKHLVETKYADVESLVKKLTAANFVTEGSSQGPEKSMKLALALKHMGFSFVNIPDNSKPSSLPLLNAAYNASNALLALIGTQESNVERADTHYNTDTSLIMVARPLRSATTDEKLSIMDDCLKIQEEKIKPVLAALDQNDPRVIQKNSQVVNRAMMFRNYKIPLVPLEMKKHILADNMKDIRMAVDMIREAPCETFMKTMLKSNMLHVALECDEYGLNLCSNEDKMSLAKDIVDYLKINDNNPNPNSQTLGFYTGLAKLEVQNNHPKLAMEYLSQAYSLTESMENATDADRIGLLVFMLEIALDNSNLEISALEQTTWSEKIGEAADKAAKEEKPVSLKVLETLGKFELKRGNIDLALKFYAKALEKAEKDQETEKLAKLLIKVQEIQDLI